MLFEANMKSIAAPLFGLLLVSTAIPSLAQTFREEMNAGLLAYKNAHYAAAIGHFQNAAQLEPQSETAHLSLATAFAEQYIPGVESPDNILFGDSAISEYKRVLEINPKSQKSLKGIAYLYLQMKKFEDAKSFYKQAIDADPDDPEAYYSVGVIDWTESYTRHMETREKLGLRPDQVLPVDAPECWELRSSNEAAILDGMAKMAKAIELRPDYDDAMAYMNLLYRERADIQCGDAKGQSADLQTADHWVDLTLASKRKKSEAAKDKNPTVPQ